MTVLIVEDDPDQLALRAMLIERSGFQVLRAADPSSALQLASVHRPDCVIVDLGLPTEGDGVRLIRELRGVDGKMRIVVLTGGRRERVQQLAGLATADDVWIKPLASALLIEKLKSMAAEMTV